MGQDRLWGLESLTTSSNPTAQRPSQNSSRVRYSLERGTCTALELQEGKVGRGVCLVTKYVQSKEGMLQEGIFRPFTGLHFILHRVAVTVKREDVCKTFSPWRVLDKH